MRLKIFNQITFLLLLTLATSACITSNPAHEISTPTSEPTLTATPTIVWFPPTTTPSPRPPTPIAVPTSDKRPGLGDLFLEDEFVPESLWTLFRVEAGSAAIGVNELTIAAVKPKVVLSSYYQGSLPQNYYLEIKINTSLCRGLDMYGLLLHTSSPQNGYRFVINCNGQVRFDWVRSGSITPIYDWTASGQVPPGSPVEFRLGVWSFGNEMRFFINDFYQFSVEKLTLADGGLGVFARAAADTPLTVNFSHLQVRQVIQLPSLNSSQ